MSKTSTHSEDIKTSNADLTDAIHEDALLEPRAHVIQNILNYSKALSVKSSKSVGDIEIVRN